MPKHGHGVIGKLLPEQVDFFSEQADLADVIDFIEEFIFPYFVYVDGDLVRELRAGEVEDAYQLGEELETEDNRVVILDYAGSVVFSNVNHPPLRQGNFQLVYTIQSAMLWDFFLNGAGIASLEGPSELYSGPGDYGKANLSVSPIELAQTTFEEDDFFINDAPHQPALHQALKEMVADLQQIAKLYPLLEIKIYP